MAQDLTGIGRMKMMHVLFVAKALLSVFSFMVKSLINTEKNIQTSGPSEELKLSKALFKLNLPCLHSMLTVLNDDFCSPGHMQQSFLPFLLYIPASSEAKHVRSPVKNLYLYLFFLTMNSRAASTNLLSHILLGKNR